MFFSHDLQHSCRVCTAATPRHSCLRMSALGRSVIQGASDILTRTLLMGRIRRSRPVYSTLLDMSSIPWQHFAGENSTNQSIAHRYLLSSALLLTRLSRFVYPTSLLLTTVLSHCGLHSDGVMIREAKGRQALGIIIVTMQIGEDKI